MAQRLLLPDEEKNVRAPNSLGNARALDWWSWRGRGTLVRGDPEPTRKGQGQTEQAWRLRWQALLSCAAAKAFAASLLELRGGQGADGDVPWAHEVENTFKYAGLSGLG